MFERERLKTAEELNAELYEKVSAEFEEYKNNLLMMSPEQMLEHAYAYAIRSDIVVALEYHELRARQAQALLNADNSLDEIFSKWENLETKHMECVRDAIECQATEALEKEVEVEAEDRDEAEQIVSDAWHNSEYILDAEDFKGVTFKAEPPARKRESYER